MTGASAGRPRIVLVVNVDEADESALSIITATLRDAGLHVSVAFRQSELSALVGRGECDIAVVDASCRGGTPLLRRLAAGWKAPPVLVSLRLFRPSKATRWPPKRVEYTSAQGLAAELRALVAEWERDRDV